jgi:gamma-glutamyltranspeptidase/glutathione hydrolase
MNSETGSGLKIRVIHAEQKELLKDFEKAVEFDQSTIFKKTYSEEFGTPGGETIGQTQFQHLINIVDRGMPVQAAIEAPRLALDPDPGFYTPGAAITLQLESRFPEASFAALRAMGHKVAAVGPYSIGSIQAVLKTAEGTRIAGSDPRRMGYAVGY